MKPTGLPDLQLFLTTHKVHCSRRRGRNASNLWAARTLCAVRRKHEADLLKAIDKAAAASPHQVTLAVLEATHKAVSRRADPHCPVCGKERCFNDPRKQRRPSTPATYVS
jgi:hypothetical protein